MTKMLPLLLTLLLSINPAKANQVIPGLEHYPTDVTCCPTVPLVGPVWLVDTTSLSFDINDECTFVPTASRPMVFVFQPNGVVNAFSDVKACHYAHGSYSMTPSSSPYNYHFRWNRWKSQPYSCLPVHCGTNDNEIDIFWTRIASTVTNLAITGYTNVELRDSNGTPVVRLEALSASYQCKESPSTAQEMCDSEVPRLDALGMMPTNTLLDYKPDQLATGGGGLSGPEQDYTIEYNYNQGGGNSYAKWGQNNVKDQADTSTRESTEDPTNNSDVGMDSSDAGSNFLLTSFMLLPAMAVIMVAGGL